MRTLSLVVPSYNEEDNILSFYEQVSNEVSKVEYNYEIIFIDDGSKDGTYNTLKKLSNEKENVKFISFTRNFGKEAAILAGLTHSSGDAVILMDADLQHPPSLLDKLIKGYEEGYDQVIAKRNRKGDPLLKTILAGGYYKLMNKFIDVSLESGIGDFRLLSRKAVNSILTLTEYNRFSKGIFSWIGYNQKIIEYENVARLEGESKWSISNLLNYGIDGVISFNNKPLRICLYTGLFILLFSILYIFITLSQILVKGIDVPGYFTTIASVLFLGGIQLVSLGIIGEYIGRIYYETKHRPHYIINDTNIK